ncbi:MAG: inner membrane CreD family protein [Deltaproteobacteria bacterium]|nr:inner membrane CreD family protein [Deltaproteobacteria bacterium]
MNQILRLFALVAILAGATVAWVALGGFTSARTSSQQGALYGAVADLWGQPQEQVAPGVQFAWQVPIEHDEWQVPIEHDEVVKEFGKVVYDEDGQPLVRRKTTYETRQTDVDLASSDIAVDLHLDQRRKGLMWFPLYDVNFAGTWSYLHDDPHPGTLRIRFEFPVANGLYDDFRFSVDGREQADVFKPSGGAVEVPVEVTPGQLVGMTQWTYRPNRDHGVGQLEQFKLVMTTDFADIDYPSFTMSPSTRERVGGGWELAWTFRRLVAGHGMGMVMPERVQPGPLASSLSFSAPISLGLFMLWIYVFGLLRRIEVHPVNHLFLAAAFFSFHLLFAYSADHLPVEAAFALSSVVSVALVVTYLRLVVGPRFAFVEAGLAQLLYLVGFSLAHFWEGYTGLTLTVLGIVTLFALMQLTGRMRWSEVFSEHFSAEVPAK